jgi:molybdopterin/thiamine biosynthesis adenylyltransferase
MKGFIHANCKWPSLYNDCVMSASYLIVHVFDSYVLGHEAMQKMSVAHVLIIGLKGLGVEIGTISLPTE